MGETDREKKLEAEYLVSDPVKYCSIDRQCRVSACMSHSKKLGYRDERDVGR
jgi:hypothetical protein